MRTDEPLGIRVLELSRRVGLRRPPATFWMNEPNAFAMGDGAENGVVAIGRPFEATLTSEELDAVIGHELGHIVCNDMQRMTFGRAFQQWLSWFLVFRGLQSFVRWIITPISEALLMAHSRHREYWADAIGASLTSKDVMISALHKIHAVRRNMTDNERKYAAFMFRGITSGLFRTHPTLEQRVAALQMGTYLSRIRFFSDFPHEITAEQPAVLHNTYADGL